MSWPVIFRELKKEYEPDPTRPGVSIRKRTDGEKLVIGDAYYIPEDLLWKHAQDGHTIAMGMGLTKEFETSGRPPIAVVLPDGYHFIIDGAYWSRDRPNPNRDGWHVMLSSPPVVGKPLLVTLSPSINIVGSYHGWIQNGTISDDCEGRKFS